MPFASKRADLLARSLQGYKSTDSEVRDLVATATRIPALTSAACAPQPEFVSALGTRLRAEALTLPARKVRPVSPAVQGQATGGRPTTRPIVFVIGRGLPRVLAGATASLLLVGAVIAGASRSALPGGLLYPVKALLDSAAVQLAGSDFDRGMTWLSQAQDHISDAAALVDRDGVRADAELVDGALLRAYDAVNGGQRALLGEFDRTADPHALVAVRDFVARALPQLVALRPLVPVDSTPAVDALITLLQDSRTSLARKVAVCGQPCASLGSAAPEGSSVSAPPGGLPSTVTAGSVPIPRSTVAITGPGGVLAPPIPRGSIGGLPLPTAGGDTGVIVPSVSVPLGTVAPIPGVGPSVSLPVTIPGVTIGLIAPTAIGPLTVSPSPIVIPPIPPSLPGLP